MRNSWSDRPRRLRGIPAWRKKGKKKVLITRGSKKGIATMGKGAGTLDSARGEERGY